MWQKMGLVYGPDGRLPWATNSALTPTPVLIGDTIRVFAGFRDDAGVSRIGYVDLDADRPSTVIDVSTGPALDIGRPGMFDDNGVILGDIVPDGKTWRMYYIGFQKVAKAKFLAFTGLAVSDERCALFERVSQAPIFDRSDEGLFIRAIHTARKDTMGWRVWYAAGSRWQRIKGIDYPHYEIRTALSNDGIHLPTSGTLCLAPQGEEYRIGRPRVYKRNNVYEMMFTKGDIDGAYTPGWASSVDGENWTRRDEHLNLPLSSGGWDSETLSYPSIIEYKNKRYIFYNGNKMGFDGFGYAEWVE